MNTIAKNIKQLRKKENLTQDELAAKLTITRQAISNWENGRTQPDVDMLINIAKTFDTDVNEVIYGERQPQETYPVKRKRQVTLALIFGVITVLIFSAWLLVMPYVVKGIESDQIKVYLPLFFAYMFSIPRLSYLVAPVFFLSVLSLKKDIRVKNSIIRICFLIAGVLLAIALFVPCAYYMCLSVSKHYYLLIRKLPYGFYCVPGILIYLGINT